MRDPDPKQKILDTDSQHWFFTSTRFCSLVCCTPVYSSEDLLPICLAVQQQFAGLGADSQRGPGCGAHTQPGPAQQDARPKG